MSPGIGTSREEVHSNHFPAKKWRWVRKVQNFLETYLSSPVWSEVSRMDLKVDYWTLTVEDRYQWVSVWSQNGGFVSFVGFHFPISSGVSFSFEWSKLILITNMVNLSFVWSSSTLNIFTRFPVSSDLSLALWIRTGPIPSFLKPYLEIKSSCGQPNFWNVKDLTYRTTIFVTWTCPPSPVILMSTILPNS